MGNVEIKALLCGNGTVDDDALVSLHRQFTTYNERHFAVDRSAFALLYKGLRFSVIDQVYDALLLDSESRSSVVAYRDIVLPLLLASTLPVEVKTRILHEALLAIDGEEATIDVVASVVATAATLAVVPMRGLEDASGRITYPAYRCHGCRQVPCNLVFACLDCPAPPGMIMGVFAGVVFCKGCAGTWEGQGVDHVHHSPTHRMEKLKLVPNPKALSFKGTGCSGCGVCPIVGPRLRCSDCTDFTELCSTCYGQGEMPGAHNATHVLESISRPQSLRDDVYRVLFDFGFVLPPYDPDSAFVAEIAKKRAAGTPLRVGPSACDLEELTMHHLASPRAFCDWVARSERLYPLFAGILTHCVPRCLDEETYDRSQTETRPRSKRNV